ncbi:MAG: CRISPR-associated endonuclease Cas2 [Blastocatellia bacterium]|nr:CRISPR-associated endonuclease Cas2 [Blastocatellia bacterium]HMW03083.1 CRISPR-associated endonuclease Cas2 [Acidobacteriota bacterium]
MNSAKKTLYVVVYDVSDDQQRAKLNRWLHRFGIAVQYSVFECRITLAQFNELKTEALTLIDQRTDRIRFFEVCVACSRQTISFGKMPSSDIKPAIIW